MVQADFLKSSSFTICFLASDFDKFFFLCVQVCLRDFNFLVFV